MINEFSGNQWAYQALPVKLENEQHSMRDIHFNGISAIPVKHCRVIQNSLDKLQKGQCTLNKHLLFRKLGSKSIQSLKNTGCLARNRIRLFVRNFNNNGGIGTIFEMGWLFFVWNARIWRGMIEVASILILIVLEVDASYAPNVVHSS